MRRHLTLSGWILLTLMPLLVWWFLYLGTQREYDEDLAYFLLALLVAIATQVLLYLLRRADKTQYRRRLIIRLWALLLGSPVTFVFLIGYVDYIMLQLQWIQSRNETGLHWQVAKYQNSFKSRYVCANGNNDTLVITINRHGALLSTLQLEKGREVPVSPEPLQRDTVLRQIGVFEY